VGFENNDVVSRSWRPDGRFATVHWMERFKEKTERETWVKVEHPHKQGYWSCNQLAFNNTSGQSKVSIATYFESGAYHG